MSEDCKPTGLFTNTSTTFEAKASGGYLKGKDVAGVMSSEPCDPM